MKRRNSAVLAALILSLVVVLALVALPPTPRRPASTSMASSQPRATSSTSATQPPNLDQLKVLSVQPLNTSIGADLMFNVTFTNLGPSPILYDYTDITAYIPCSGATATVNFALTRTESVVNSTNDLPGCPNSLPVALDPNAQGSPGNANCFRTVSPANFAQLGPGAVASATDNFCNDRAAWKIVRQGVFEVMVTIPWGPQGLPDSHETTITEAFTVG
jgi:hypothetical protein